jgi:hypothetical protein
LAKRKPHWRIGTGKIFDPDNADARGGFEYETPEAVEIDRRATRFSPELFSEGDAEESRHCPIWRHTPTVRANPFERASRSSFWALIVYDMATYAFITIRSLASVFPPWRSHR